MPVESPSSCPSYSADRGATSEGSGDCITGSVTYGRFFVRTPVSKLKPEPERGYRSTGRAIGKNCLVIDRSPMEVGAGEIIHANLILRAIG